jgi:hypothetical protein
LIFGGGVVIGVSAGVSLTLGVWTSPDAVHGPTPPEAVAAAPPAAAVVPAAGSMRRSSGAKEKDGDEEAPRLADGVWDLVARDLDGDERPDLVLITGGPGSLSGRVSLLFDPGIDVPPSAWPSQSFETTGDYGRVAVADIDGDGIDDVAALTFSTRVLRWWLLGADHSVLDERSMSFSGAAVSGRICPGAAVLTDPPPTLSSLAFADLDLDGALELAVASYAGAGAGSLYLLSYRRASGCFELGPGAVRSTRGSLKVRFFDVDDDGVLDMVTSHYSLSRPSATSAGCRGCLEWGEWWQRDGRAATPLLARLENHELAAADPAPELNVVDFDVLRGAAGVRYALAGSAHLCPARDCWSEGQAGFVSVVDESGQALASGDAWKRRAEESPPIREARLLPRVVSFFGERERPSLAAAYWWATRNKNTACSRLNACAGPLTVGAIAEEPRALGPAMFAQALGVLSAPGAALEHVRYCQASKPLLTVPDTTVTSIIELRLDGRVLSRGSYAWVPGSRAVALSRPVAREPGQVCITYARMARERLAVADSKQGLFVISLE